MRCNSPRAGYVGSDHFEGIRLAVRHLYALGHRRIAHIAGAENTVAGSDRLESFRREADVFGLELPAGYIAPGDFSSGSGYREACALLALPSPPTAIVVASDLMALAAVRAAWEFGLEPGRDVAVVGFDDLEAAALSHPPLTTIRQDRDALGELAADHVIELAEDPQAVASHDLAAGRARRAGVVRRDSVRGVGRTSRKCVGCPRRPLPRWFHARRRRPCGRRSPRMASHRHAGQGLPLQHSLLEAGGLRQAGSLTFRLIASAARTRARRSAGADTTLRQPAGPSRGSSSTPAPSCRARRVASTMSGTPTYGSHSGWSVSHSTIPPPRRRPSSSER